MREHVLIPNDEPLDVFPESDGEPTFYKGEELTEALEIILGMRKAEQIKAFGIDEESEMIKAARNFRNTLESEGLL